MQLVTHRALGTGLPWKQMVAGHEKPVLRSSVWQLLFHDCSHGSFMPSRRGDCFWGFVTGVLTFTPFHQWRHKHAMHHATSGDLDRRGTGEIRTLTVEEYLRASRWKRLAYRLARTDAKRERRSVYWTNGALAGIAILMSLTIGVKAYLLIQLPVITLAAAAGIWLFYVQHQFEGAYWQRREDWDYDATRPTRRSGCGTSSATNANKRTGDR